MTDKTTKILIGIAVVVVVALVVMLVIGYTGDNTTGSFTEIPQKNLEPIKVGVILPMTGTSSYYGDATKKGIELAINEINSLGGINNRKINIIYEDCEGDPKKAISSYNKLKNNGISSYLAILSPVTLSLAPLVEENKDVLISIAGAAPSISTAGDYVFRHNLLPQTESKFLANYLFQNNYNEIAIIVVNSESGVSYLDEFKKDYKGNIRLLEFYQKDEKDFRSILTKIKNSHVDAILALSYITELGEILKQANQLEIDMQWFSIYTAEGEKLIELAGNSANGIIYTHFFDINSQDPKFREYYLKYKKTYNKNPEFYDTLAYDSIMLLSKAMENCEGPYDSMCIKQELYKIQNYSGVTGKISFDSNGDTHKEIILKTIKNGEFIRL